MWKEVFRLALLGTERATFPEEIYAFLEKNDLDKEDEANAILLNLISAYSTRNKLNLPLKDISKETEIAYFEFDELLPYCSQGSFQALKLILDGPYGPALTEFLNLLGEKEQLLPKVYLPEVLNLSLKDPELWTKLSPFIGKFGNWLIEQNEDWHLLSLKMFEQPWSALSKEEKVIVFEKKREINPEEARNLLESDWKDLHYKDKVNFLKVFKTGISKSDEPFLIQVAQDPRKEVRIMGTQLLTRIPESALSFEVFAWMASFLEKKDTYIKMETDDSFGEIFSKYPFQPPLQGNSLELSRIGYLISRIHPDKWTGHFNVSEREFLYLIKRGNQKREWILGLIQAYLRYKPLNWTEPLLLFWIENHGEYIWSELPMAEFAKTLSREQVELAISHERSGKGYLLEEKSPEALILQENENTWSTKLTNYILVNFRTWVNQVNTIRWDMFHYQEIFRRAAYRVSTEDYDNLRENWNQSGAGWQMWANEMENFFSILEFRKKMQHSFQ
jgi:hypothetical protein